MKLLAQLSKPLYTVTAILSLGELIMCTVGGPFGNEDIKRLESQRYACNECGSKFKGIGKNPMCPSCQSEDVTELED
ncbi:MAG: hypothetical protein ACXVI1_00370 [Halobacteriota archaeon]